MWELWLPSHNQEWVLLLSIHQPKSKWFTLNFVKCMCFWVLKCSYLFCLACASGKAAFGLLKDMAEHPEKWEGRRILFIHTGGLLGLFDKTNQLTPLVGNWRQMELHESVPRTDGVGKMFWRKRVKIVGACRNLVLDINACICMFSSLSRTFDYYCALEWCVTWL